MKAPGSAITWSPVFVLVFFATVTYYVISLAPGDAGYVSLLGMFAALVAGLTIHRLLHFKGPVIHLWAILSILLLAYYLKLCVLAFYRDMGFDALVMIAGDVSAGWIENTQVFIAAYEVMTVGFLSFCGAALAITFMPRSDASRNGIAAYPDYSKLRISRALLPTALVFITLFFFAGTYAQLSYEVGTGFARQEPLPYRLAGLLIAVQRYVVPFMYLFVLLVADRTQRVGTSRATVALYLTYGIVFGLVTTSKSHAFFAIASLAVLWATEGTFSRRRIWLTILGLLISVFFSRYLADVRLLRANVTISFMETLASPLFGSEFLPDTGVAGVERTLILIAIITRAVGIDALLNVVGYDPSFSLERLTNFLSGEISLDKIYALEVVGMPEEWLDRSAFAPSLFGAFYVLTGGTWGMGIGVGIYVFVWHLIFYFADRSGFVLRPVLLSMLLMSILFFTSEGTVETMPFTLLLIGVTALSGEYVLRLLLGEGSYHALRRMGRGRHDAGSQ